MKRMVSRVRRPVRREGADVLLLLTLLSFGASVSVTRLFLELTGYPQLGSGSLHIAHVLWGGLLLFVASLLPLLLANRWVYRVGAVLAGIGVGLFIDEVGKFITQTNDYFHPAAAPIVYAFFLLTVLLYYRVRRPPSRNPRAEMYRVLEALEELLDHDLDAEERAGLEARLTYVASQSQEPAFADLARHLLGYLQDDLIELAPNRSTRWDRLVEKMVVWEGRVFTHGRMRAALAGALLALGLWSLLGLAQAVTPWVAATHVEELVIGGRLGSSIELAGFSTRLALESAVGLLYLSASVLMAIDRTELGVTIGSIGLLLALTTVNLLVFYFEQFSTIITATVELIVLLALLRFRTRFVSRARRSGAD
jgi:hypothetical protein